MRNFYPYLLGGEHINPIALRKAKIVYNFGLSVLAFLSAVGLKYYTPGWLNIIVFAKAV